jgi:imidazoleglycerol-phosphate dehydratase
MGSRAVSTRMRKCAKLGGGEAIMIMDKRRAIIKRETKETNIRLELNLDGSGVWEISTGIKMFDHLLSQLAQHGRLNLKVAASGDDQHHLIEDVAICLGKAINQALGEKRSIVRMGDATVPMDDALGMVAVDISGRGYTVLELSFSGNDMAGFPSDLIRHFLESFAIEARINLHARVLYGTNDHHKAEVLFKALGRALDMAIRIDERISGELPSTKGLMEE